jgi:hypothetical protein
MTARVIGWHYMSFIVSMIVIYSDNYTRMVWVIINGHYSLMSIYDSWRHYEA